MNRTVSELLKYQFSKDETAAQSQELARQIQALQRLEDQKKEVVANLKAQIESASALAKDLSQKITNGYEYRSVTCKVTLHDPKKGEKSIYRQDTGELVRTLPMAPEEMQEVLPIWDGKEPQ